MAPAHRASASVTCIRTAVVPPKSRRMSAATGPADDTGRHPGRSGPFEHGGHRSVGRRDHDARGALAEERRGRAECRRKAGGVGSVDGRLDADAPGVERALRERDCQAPVGAVVRRLDEPGPHQTDHQVLNGPLARQVERRRGTGHRAVQTGQVLRAAELSVIVAQNDHRCTGRPEGTRDRLRRILEQPDHAQDRRRVDGPALGLVVQADVAAGDRHAERAARVADAPHRLAELPHDLGPLGVAEVQVVGGADRLGAGAGDVTGRLGHRQHRPAVRIEVAIPSVAVHRHRQSLAGALDADDAGGATGRRDGVGAHRVVELLVGPALARHDRRGQQRLEGGLRRRRGAQRREVELLHGGLPLRTRHRTPVDRAFVGERAGRHVGHQHAVVVQTDTTGVGHVADAHRVQVPLLEHRLNLALAAGLGDQQHALLRLRQHDLVRRHAGLALRHERHLHLHAAAAAGAHLGGSAGESGGAHVLDVLIDESMENNVQDQEEAAANAFASELLTGNADVRFGTSGRWPNAKELAESARQMGRQLRIAPGHIVLNYAHSMGHGFMLQMPPWPESSQRKTR